MRIPEKMRGRNRGRPDRPSGHLEIGPPGIAKIAEIAKERIRNRGK
jgi:hypothetical protein